jgi:O-antigen/teichoic acid export membrane protein
MRIDQVMIKNMLGDREVGLYSAAIKLVEVWYFIPMIITQSVFPTIVNAKRVSEKLYYKRLQQLFSFLVIINVLISILITILSKKIVHILYGDKFIEVSYVLQIVVWSTVFVSLFVSSGSWLINENYTTIALYRNLSAAIVNIILNMFLINWYGIKGAAYAIFLSFFISGFLFDLYHPKTRSIFFIKLRALNIIGVIMYEKNRNL